MVVFSKILRQKEIARKQPLWGCKGSEGRIFLCTRFVIHPNSVKIITIFTIILLLISCNNPHPEESNFARSVENINNAKKTTNPKADFALQKGVAFIKNDSGHLAFPLLKAADRLYQRTHGLVNHQRVETLTYLGEAYEQFSLHSDSASYFINQALGLLQQDTSLQQYAAKTYLAKAKILRYERSFMEALSYANMTLQRSKNLQTLDTNLMVNCHIVRAKNLRKLGMENAAEKEHEMALYLASEKSDDNDLLKAVYEAVLLNYIAKGDEANFHHYLNKLKTECTDFLDAFQHPDCLEAYYNYHKGNEAKALQAYLELIEKYKDSKERNPYFFDEAYYLIRSIYENKSKLDSANLFLEKSAAYHLGSKIYKGNLMETVAGNLEAYNPKTCRLFTSLIAAKASLLLKIYKENPADILVLEQCIFLYTKFEALFFNHAGIVDENAFLAFGKEQLKLVYNNAVEAAFLFYEKTQDEKYLETALQFMERGKYTLLYRETFAQKEAARKVAIPEELLETEKKITHALKEMRQRIYDNPQATDFANEMLSLFQKQNAIQQKIKQSNTGFYEQRNFPKIPAIEKIQDKLIRKDEVLLEYHVGERQLYLLVLTGKKVIFKAVEKPASFEKNITRYLEILSDPTNAFKGTAFKQYAKLAHSFYELFWLPIENELPENKTLLICQDASFPILPFETFIAKFPTAENINYKDLAYLLRQYTMRYISSLKQYAAESEDLLPFTNQSKILAYAFSDTELSESSDSWASFFRFLPFSELPGSGQELQTMEEIFKHSGNKFRYGKESTKQDFLQSCEEHYDIIHLALHAASDPENPFGSKLYFKATTGNGQGKNNFTTMYAHEISARDIPAPLVILSACETAAGKPMASEGTYSLGRAFYAAGAERVVSTLWKVEDQVMQEVMVSFYQYLAKGNSVTISMRNAKLDYLNGRDGYLGFAGYWGGVVE